MRAPNGALPILHRRPGDDNCEPITLGGSARNLTAVRVSDVYGKGVKSAFRVGTQDAVTLELRGAAAGLYLVRLHLAGKVVTRKIEVVR